MTRRQRQARRHPKTVAAVATAAVVAVVAAAIWWVTSDRDGTSSQEAARTAAPSATSAAPTASPDSVAKDFLAAWAAGDYDKAAALTDDAAAAGPRLTAVMKSLHPNSTKLTLGSRLPAGSGSTATRFSFDVVDDFGSGLTWRYDSILAVVPATAATAPLVHWSSAVIHPQLGAQANLTAAGPAAEVVDETGVRLTSTAHPSLAAVLSKLSTARQPGAAAPTSLQIDFVDADTGAPISGAAPILIGAQSTATTAQVRTTLDDKVQRAAEKALADYPDSGMVVIKPSTGGVLAMASNSRTASGLAYHATRAPGSTFKTITASALLQAGVGAADPAPCTATATVGSQTYHNDEGLKNGYPNATLADAFVKSCNTSFVGLRNKLSGLGALADEARTHFGLNQPWDMGLGPATYCTTGTRQVPVADGMERFAAEMFGQGDITMCPLTMASVAATVATGTFKQPILVPGRQQASATPLPAAVDAALKTMMRGVVTDGTATSLRGTTSTLGAKTGTAERQGENPDSWMIAMDPRHDIAVACLVLNGGFGDDKAGPGSPAMLRNAGIG